MQCFTCERTFMRRSLSSQSLSGTGPLWGRRGCRQELVGFLSSLPGEKHVAIGSVGFVYPIYDSLSSLKSCHVTVANPNKLRLISSSSTKHDRADARILGDLLRT